MLGASSAKSSSMMQRTTATTPAPRGSLVTMSVSAFTIGSAAVSAQPEPQTAFLRSPADIGRGRGSPRGIGALGGPPGLVPTNERQSLVTEAYLARNREFESRSLQQRVRCELDLAARKSQKGQLGTRAASAAHAPRAAEAAARTQFSRSGSVEQPCIRPTRYIIPPTRARHPALGSTARTPLPGLTPRSPIG